MEYGGVTESGYVYTWVPQSFSEPPTSLLSLPDDLRCRHCSKGFRDKWHLSDHERSHELDHLCLVCNRPRSSRRHLRKHCTFKATSSVRKSSRSTSSTSTLSCDHTYSLQLKSNEDIYTSDEIARGLLEQLRVPTWGSLEQLEVLTQPPLLERRGPNIEDIDHNPANWIHPYLQWGSSEAPMSESFVQIKSTPSPGEVPMTQVNVSDTGRQNPEMNGLQVEMHSWDQFPELVQADTAFLSGAMECQSSPPSLTTSKSCRAEMFSQFTNSGTVDTHRISNSHNIHKINNSTTSRVDKSRRRKRITNITNSHINYYINSLYLPSGNSIADLPAILSQNSSDKTEINIGKVSTAGCSKCCGKQDKQDHMNEGNAMDEK